MIDLDNYTVGREQTASHIYINTHGLNKTPTACIQGPYKADSLGSCWVALAVWAHFCGSFVCFLFHRTNQAIQATVEKTGVRDRRGHLEVRYSLCAA